MPEQRFSINVAEKYYRQDIGDELDEWHHAYLMLTLDTPHSQEVLQELHFNEGNHGVMVPNLRIKNTSLKDDKDLDLFPYVSGDEENILSMWNHALQHAAKIKQQNEGLTFGYNYRHSEHANNCRTGVKALIQTMGMTFCDEFTKTAAGTKAEGVPAGKTFSFDDSNDSIEELWAENQKLAEDLEPLPKIQVLLAKDIQNLEPF